MSIQETLQNEIQESKRWVDTAEGVYKRDLTARIELIRLVNQYVEDPSDD